MMSLSVKEELSVLVLLSEDLTSGGEAAGHGLKRALDYITLLETRITELDRRSTAQSEVLELHRAAFSDLFGQCCSNPIYNAWQQQVDCTKLNIANEAAHNYEYSGFATALPDVIEQPTVSKLSTDGGDLFIVDLSLPVDGADPEQPSA